MAHTHSPPAYPAYPAYSLQRWFQTTKTPWNTGAPHACSMNCSSLPRRCAVAGPSSTKCAVKLCNICKKEQHGWMNYVGCCWILLDRLKISATPQDLQDSLGLHLRFGHHDPIPELCQNFTLRMWVQSSDVAAGMPVHHSPSKSSTRNTIRIYKK